MIFQARLSMILALSAATLVAFTADARAATGEIGYAGCLTGELSSGGSGSGACSQITAAGQNGGGTAFDSLRSIALSSDGKSAYAASRADAAIVHLTRDPQSGQLGAAGCISGDRETDEVCELVGSARSGGGNSGLDFLQAVVVSPDGRHVYAVSEGDDAIARFDRNAATGALTYAGCLSGEAESAGACATIATAAAAGVHSGLDRPRALVISADGRSVYAISQDDDALVSFDRNSDTGALSFAGCISGNTAANGCARVPGAAFGGAGSGLSFPGSVAVSGDDRSVYVGSIGDDAIAIFGRNASGSLTFDECVSAETEVVACAPVSSASAGGVNSGLDAPQAVAVSPDGTSVYAAAGGDDAVARFVRAADGRLEFAGCITGESESAPACVRIDGDAPGGADSGLDGLRSVDVSADGNSVYVVSEADDAVAHFARDQGSGALTYASCISGESETAIAGCTLVGAASADGFDSGLDGLQDAVVSADGSNVYAASIADDAVSAYTRELAPPPSDPAGADTKAPALDLSGARVQRSRRAIAITASCDEACKVEVVPSGRPGIKGGDERAAKRIALQPARAEVEADGSTELRLRLDGARSKRLAREVLAANGRIAFRLRGTASDAAGNTSADTLAVTLRGGRGGRAGGDRTN
jgi:DNA-binding beta-propeller fold protein YncE